MTRALVAATLIFGGCFAAPPTGYPPPRPSQPPPAVAPPPVVTVGSTWTLVLDSASVQDLGYGVPPDISVTALVDGQQVTSPIEYGTFDGVWNTPLLDADEATFESGIDLQVWADYGGGATLVGEVVLTPTPDELGAGPLDLGAFDYVDDLQVELAAG